MSLAVRAFRCRIAVESCPAVTFEVVQLASSSGVEIPVPRKRLNDDTLRKKLLQRLLGVHQSVQRHAHIHMVSHMLHDVVEQTSDSPPKSKMYGGRHEGLRAAPFISIVVPRDADVGVVHGVRGAMEQPTDLRTGERIRDVDPPRSPGRQSLVRLHPRCDFFLN
jgi:hypothetical protein